MTRFVVAGSAAGFLFLPALEVVPDHVHLFVKDEPKASVSCVANQVKGFTSRMVREEFPHLKSRMPTCGRRSSSPPSRRCLVCADTVEKYINTQWEKPEVKRAPRV